MIKEPLFTGLCTALVTPFRKGSMDEAALRGLVRRQIASGVRALVACGTTGEASTLTDVEWERTLRITLETARDKAIVLAGTGTNDLRRTLERARTAAALGAHAQLTVTPYYNKTTQRGLVDYFTRVADGSGLPLMMYNVPGRTGLNLLPETAARLAEHPLIIGVKEASGDLNQMAELLRLRCLPVYCGSDELIAPALRLGAAGAVSVVSNLLPEEARQLCAADYAEASALQQTLQPLIRALFFEVSPAPVKAALELMGLCSAEVRSPLVPVEEATRQRLRALLRQEVRA